MSIYVTMVSDICLPAKNKSELKFVVVHQDCEKIKVKEIKINIFVPTLHKTLLFPKNPLIFVLKHIFGLVKCFFFISVQSV